LLRLPACQPLPYTTLFRSPGPVLAHLTEPPACSGSAAQALQLLPQLLDQVPGPVQVGPLGPARLGGWFLHGWGIRADQRTPVVGLDVEDHPVGAVPALEPLQG